MNDVGRYLHAVGGAGLVGSQIQGSEVLDLIALDIGFTCRDFNGQLIVVAAFLFGFETRRVSVILQVVYYADIETMNRIVSAFLVGPTC